MTRDPSSTTLPAVADVCRDFTARWRLDERLEPFAGHRFRGESDARQLQLDDFSGIPFLDGISGVPEYQHRARLRARGGDLLVTVSPQRPGEEDYYRRMGLGVVDWIGAEGSHRPLELAAACRDPSLLEALARRAADAGGLVIHPFMGIESVWELAASLTRAAATDVEVLAPPPPVTWIANDKGAFSDLVVALLGPEWVAAERRSRDPGALARGLLELGETASRVALKRMRCASAMGNRVYDSGSLRAGGLAGAREQVERFLSETRWDGDEDVQAVVWEDTELSPSTQWWLPPLEGGSPPVLDGIYEQILVGAEKVFAGSRPSTLPAAVHRGLAEAGATVARALQGLGYVGRCSFDHLVVGDPDGDHALRFSECNGRWGGTSIPMHFVDRLFGAPPRDETATDPAPSRRPYRAMDIIHPSLVGVTFAEVLDRVGDRAFDPATGEGRFLFYNVGPLERHGKLDVIALGETPDEATFLLDDELPRLLGL